MVSKKSSIKRALSAEFQWANLSYAREIEMDIYYKHLENPIGRRRADFVVENRVLVELKAVRALDEAHLAQAINYLEAYRLKVGLLINFGSKSMEFRRVIRT